MVDSLPSTYDEAIGVRDNQEFQEKVSYPTEAEQEFTRYPQILNATPLGEPYPAQEQYPQVQQPDNPTQTLHSANVTVSTDQQMEEADYVCYCESTIAVAVFSLFLCFPFGIPALILAIIADRIYIKDRNSQKPVRYLRVAMALGITGLLLGLISITIIIVPTVIVNVPISVDGE